MKNWKQITWHSRKENIVLLRWREISKRRKDWCQWEVRQKEDQDFAEK